VIAPASGEPSWYPYPFLNPAQPGGYGGVALYVLLIAAIIIGAAALVVWVGRRRAVVSDSTADATIAAA
jgi:hypothetical protein